MPGWDGAHLVTGESRTGPPRRRSPRRAPSASTGPWVFTDVDGEPHPPPYFDPDPDDSEVSRDVELPGKLRQVTDSAIGYDVETVISARPGGPAMWQRFTAYSGQLERRQEDARRVLETVVPFDPSAVPQPIGGLG